MMLAHPDLENIIELQPGAVSTLVIENQTFFRNFIQDIYRQTEGSTGKAVLSDGYKELDFTRYSELIESYVSFTVNSKKLQSKLISFFEKEAASEDRYLETAEFLRTAETYLNHLTEDFSTEISYGSLNPGALLKAVNMYVSEESSGPLERIIDYMELTRELERDKLFIFTGMRSYFTDEELEPFLQNVLAKEFQILLIDGYSHKRFAFENRLIIDEDLCEI